MKKPTQVNMHILYVANKYLPGNDYRVVYPEYSQVCSVTYALPSRPDTVDDGRYVYMGVGEGLRLSYVYHLGALLIYLLKNRREFDLVHFYSTNLILWGPILSRCAGLPSLITVTGFGRVFSRDQVQFRLLRPLYMLLMRISGRLAVRVLFQNCADMQWLAQRLASSSHKFRYASSAVSMPAIHDKPPSSPRLRVLLVARLMPDKGIKDFLQVAQALHDEGFEFVLVGPGSQGHDALLAQVRDYHNRGVIDYKGELQSSATYEEFARAHVFCFLSSYAEGMARVMLEAGFARACPVAYDIPANRELVADGRGFLVEKGNVSGVITVLKELSKDRNALMRNAVAYQEHILAGYNIETFARRMDVIVSETASEVKKRG